MDGDRRKQQEAAVYNKQVNQGRRAYKDYFDRWVYTRLMGMEYTADYRRLAEEYLRDKKVLVIGASRKDVDLIWPYTHAVTAVDISELMIEKLMERYPSVRGVVGDAENLSTLVGSFDVIFAKSVLHHLHPLDRVLDEISVRLVEDGVLFVASEPGYWHPFALVGRRLAPSREHTEGERAFDYSLFERSLERRFLCEWKSYYFLSSVMLAVLPAFVPLFRKVCLRLVRPVIWFERWLIDRVGFSRWCWMTMGVYKKSKLKTHN